MSQQVGNTIFARQGEDIVFSIPVYRNGVLVTDIQSAKFAYFGTYMTTPTQSDCLVVAGGTIQKTLTNVDTTDMSPGLYAYEFQMTKTDTTVDEPVESGFIVIRSSLIG